MYTRQRSANVVPRGPFGRIIKGRLGNLARLSADVTRCVFYVYIRIIMYGFFSHRHRFRREIRPIATDIIHVYYYYDDNSDARTVFPIFSYVHAVIIDLLPRLSTDRRASASRSSATEVIHTSIIV